MEGMPMRFIKPSSLIFATLLTLGLLHLPGCTMTIKDKEEKTGAKKVDIDTPMGSMRVREEADVRDTGLTVYPGARRRERKSDDHDSHSANVNISSSLFGLKVVAVEFESDDAPDKIADYYKKELKKFGEVVRCKGKGNFDDFNIDAGTHKDARVTCGDDDEKGSGVELKAGSNNNQHVVSIDSNGTGSRFALVYVQARGKGETI